MKKERDEEKRLQAEADKAARKEREAEAAEMKALRDAATAEGEAAI